MTPFIQTHEQLLGAVAGYWVFSAAVSTMPTPTEKSGVAYVWAYHFLHAVSANLDRYMQSKGVSGAPGNPGV